MSCLSLVVISLLKLMCHWRWCAPVGTYIKNYFLIQRSDLCYLRIITSLPSNLYWDLVGYTIYRPPLNITNLITYIEVCISTYYFLYIDICILFKLLPNDFSLYLQLQTTYYTIIIPSTRTLFLLSSILPFIPMSSFSLILPLVLFLKLAIFVNSFFLIFFFLRFRIRVTIELVIFTRRNFIIRGILSNIQRHLRLVSLMIQYRR